MGSRIDSGGITGYKTFTVAMVDSSCIEVTAFASYFTTPSASSFGSNFGTNSINWLGKYRVSFTFDFIKVEGGILALSLSEQNGKHYRTCRISFERSVGTWRSCSFLDSSLGIAFG